MQSAIHRRSPIPETHRGTQSGGEQKVLFVAPTSSGQLQMVSYFWDFYRPNGYAAEFAALENTPIHPSLNASMREYEHELTSDQIPSIFMLSTTCKNFDSIICLGGFKSENTVSPFMKTLEILFGSAPKRICWDILDTESIKGDEEEMMQTALDIRNRIEFELAQLTQSIEEN